MKLKWGIVEYGMRNKLGPFKSYRDCVDALNAKFPDETSQTYLTKNVPSFNRIRSFLFAYANFHFRKLMKPMYLCI